MAEAQATNQEQAALWNGPAGETWVELQSLLDTIMAPVADLLAERAVRADTHRVLDIGCGAGATTFVAARRLAAGGSCVGLDISANLVEHAQRRAAEMKVSNVTFICADAQTHAFEPNAFDVVISRFGVMFFDDPVAAFVNIRRGVSRGGTLAFAAWRAAADNPFMTAAARAAAPFLPSLPKPDPNAPGQFGFADPDRVRGILDASGWKAIDIESSDVPMSVAESDLMTYVTRMGPVGLALRDADDATRTRTIAAVRDAFIPFVKNGTARFVAACWLVSAAG